MSGSGNTAHDRPASSPGELSTEARTDSHAGQIESAESAAAAASTTSAVAAATRPENTMSVAAVVTSPATETTKIKIPVKISSATSSSPVQSVVGLDGGTFDAVSPAKTLRHAANTPPTTSTSPVTGTPSKKSKTRASALGCGGSAVKRRQSTDRVRPELIAHSLELDGASVDENWEHRVLDQLEGLTVNGTKPSPPELLSIQAELKLRMYKDVKKAWSKAKAEEAASLERVSEPPVPALPKAASAHGNHSNHHYAGDEELRRQRAAQSARECFACGWKQGHTADTEERTHTKRLMDSDFRRQSFHYPSNIQRQREVSERHLKSLKHLSATSQSLMTPFQFYEWQNEMRQSSIDAAQERVSQQKVMGGITMAPAAASPRSTSSGVRSASSPRTGPLSVYQTDYNDQTVSHLLTSGRLEAWPARNSSHRHNEYVDFPKLRPHRKQPIPSAYLQRNLGTNVDLFLLDVIKSPRKQAHVQAKTGSKKTGRRVDRQSLDYPDEYLGLCASDFQ
eukprot:scpid43069/ scgid17013/ 